MTHLSKVSSGQNAYKEVDSSIIVSGKSLSPYLIPRKVSLVCDKPEKGCASKCSYTTEQTLDLFEDLKNIPKLISCKSDNWPKLICKICNLGSCPITVKVAEMENIEQLILIPDTSSEDKGETYVVRVGLSVGGGTEANKAYDATLFTIPDPSTNIAIHIIPKLKPKDSTLDEFKPSARVMEDIIRTFSPETSTRDAITQKLIDISEALSKNVTKIYNRRTLTIGVDLIFHSALHFYLGNEYIHKGWGEALLLGDTQCGKGATCERLVKYYGVGEMVSGENATFAGLVGGIQTINDKGMLTWGRIVLNNRSLVIIDEISSLAIDGILRKLSRIRSEGISEIDKAGVHSRAEACTRLIWIANPKFGSPMNAYTFGVNALSELIGANEDIARFDFVLTVMQGEVSSNTINTRHEVSDMPKDLDRTLINWIWSRKSKQIHFSPQAIDKIYAYSIEVPKRYSQDVPLIQPETFRIKLAKVSVMIAGRLAMTDPPYTDLFVNDACVDVALEFLEKTYTAPGLAYDAYSKSSKYSPSQVQIDVISHLPKGLKRILLDNKFISEEMITQTTKVPTLAVIKGLLESNILYQKDNILVSRIYNLEIK